MKYAADDCQCGRPMTTFSPYLSRPCWAYARPILLFFSFFLPCLIGQYIFSRRAEKEKRAAQQEDSNKKSRPLGCGGKFSKELSRHWAVACRPPLSGFPPDSQQTHSRLGDVHQHPHGTNDENRPPIVSPVSHTLR